MKPLPKLSHLQFLVTGSLRAGPMSGRDIRGRLEGLGVRKSGPGFYQLMARLEDAGLVTGTYHQEIVSGQIIRERHYSLTGQGHTEWRASAEFYVATLDEFGGLEGLARV